MKAFFDTFGFVAWANPSDPAHVAVGNWLSVYTGRFLTTEWILMQYADALCSQKQRGTAVAFIDSLRLDAQFEIIPYDTAVYQAGYDLFAARPDKDWSLTDCISFAVMARLGLTDALTGDRHFEQAGFRAVFKV